MYEVSNGCGRSNCEIREGRIEERGVLKNLTLVSLGEFKWKLRKN